MKAKTVNEALSDVLKPKSSEEILKATEEFLRDQSSDGGDVAFMDYEEEKEEVFDRMLKIMKTDIGDLHFFEDGNYPEEYDRAENILRKVSASHKAPYIHVEDSDFNYAINKNAKITFGTSPTSGFNVIFFNYPHVINLIKKWGKSQT